MEMALDSDHWRTAIVKKVSPSHTEISHTFTVLNESARRVGDLPKKWQNRSSPRLPRPPRGLYMQSAESAKSAISREKIAPALN